MDIFHFHLCGIAKIDNLIFGLGLGLGCRCSSGLDDIPGFILSFGLRFGIIIELLFGFVWDLKIGPLFGLRFGLRFGLGLGFGIYLSFGPGIDLSFGLGIDLNRMSCLFPSSGKSGNNSFSSYINLNHHFPIKLIKGVVQSSPSSRPRKFNFTCSVVHIGKCAR